MSRSFRRTPIFGNTPARSEKADKQCWHSRRRAHERVGAAQLQALAGEDAPELAPVDARLVSNPWDMAKDGKHYWSVKDMLSSAERQAQRRGRCMGRVFYGYVGK